MRMFLFVVYAAGHFGVSSLHRLDSSFLDILCCILQVLLFCLVPRIKIVVDIKYMQAICN